MAKPRISPPARPALTQSYGTIGIVAVAAALMFTGSR